MFTSSPFRVERMKKDGVPSDDMFTLIIQLPILIRPSGSICGSAAGLFSACVLMTVAKRYICFFSEVALAAGGPQVVAASAGSIAAG